ncbi:hypothetical protein [Streptomyces sp. PsTaAH-124]|uniref:hypothetical protein n=1 Tax=Streptomyces sp. PsTaAH-124 TaxID=1157638 RepID=UPI00037D0833|nr:hypothetical protein [Streptomyces sp. PsTaAH-124]
MDVLLTFYYQHPSGSGYVDLGCGRATVRTENGLTETLARESMAAFADLGIRDHWKSSEPYDPAKVVISGTFGDLGTLYVDGNGVPKEKV